jgi:hypothetical protein
VSENRGEKDEIKGMVFKRKNIIARLELAARIVTLIEDVGVVESETRCSAGDVAPTPSNRRRNDVNSNILSLLKILGQGKGHASRSASDVQNGVGGTERSELNKIVEELPTGLFKVTGPHVSKPGRRKRLLAFSPEKTLPKYVEDLSDPVDAKAKKPSSWLRDLPLRVASHRERVEKFSTEVCDPAVLPSDDIG